MSKKLISVLLLICLLCAPLYSLADGTLNVLSRYLWESDV